MHDSSLLAPGTVAWHVAAASHCNREVLMPADLPVCGGRLIEQNRADREGTAAENRENSTAKALAVGKVRHYWNIEEITNAAITDDLGQDPFEVRELAQGNQIRKNCETGRANPINHGRHRAA